MPSRALATLLGLVATTSLAAEPRFFVAGDGHLTLENAHTRERLAVRYRRLDNTYDPDALARLARLFRSRGDGAVHEPALRLVEVLSHVQRLAGADHLVLYSGYRSPDYNQALTGAARASMHTEGLAADVGFARAELPLATIWHRVRALECCGVGHYAADGYLHLDVGRPRFWEKATSRVDENLAAGNARLFARTEYDRYAPGEPIVVRVHSLTAPPVRIARAAALGDARVLLDGPDCIELPGTGAALTLPNAPAVAATVRLRLTTCSPRPERTPETLETNPVVIAAPAGCTAPIASH
jgi:uncharacterized protein YcbK (DUF882 family)